MANGNVAAKLFNMDEMESGGLYGSGDGFDGIIPKMEVVPWMYKGREDLGWQTAVRIYYEPDEDSGIPADVDYQTVGKLSEWVPSIDGETPVSLPDDLNDLNDPDVLAGCTGNSLVYVGKRKDPKLNKGCKWVEWLEHATAASVPGPQNPDATSLDEYVRGGIMGHFNRVPQKVRAGVKDDAPADGSKKYPKDILVTTEFRGFKSGNGKSAPASSKSASGVTTGTATKSSAVPGTATSSRDESAVVSALLTILSNAAGNAVKKTDLPPAFIRHFAGDKPNKSLSLQLAGDNNFLAGHTDLWEFDSDTGTITLA